MLTKLKGMKYKDVSDILKCSEGAVKAKESGNLKLLHYTFFFVKKILLEYNF